MKFNESSIFKYYIPILGIILTLASIIFGIYIFYYQEQEQKLVLSTRIRNVEDIFQLNDDIENFEVMYNHQSLKESEKNIKVVYLDLLNSGATIYQNYYDDDVPFSLIVKNADIVKYEITDASSDYLKDIVRKFESDSVGSQILFKKCIFEKENFIRFKLYILCENNWDVTNLKINARIAGLKDIPTILVNPDETKEMFEIDTIEEFAKMYLLALLSLFTFMIICLIGILIAEYRRTTKLKKKINAFFIKRSANVEDNVLKKYMIDEMTNSHEAVIRSILKGNHVFNPSPFFGQNIFLIDRFYKMFLPQRVFDWMIKVPLISFPSEIFTVEHSEIFIKAPYNEILKEFYDIT